MMTVLYAVIRRFAPQHKHHRLWVGSGVWICLLVWNAWLAPASATLLIITTLIMGVVVRCNARTTLPCGAQRRTVHCMGQRTCAAETYMQHHEQGGIPSPRPTAARTRADLARTAKRVALHHNLLVVKQTTRY